MSGIGAYQADAEAAATANGIPVGLFEGLISQESDWSQTATSGAGAYGLTQLMPGTANDLGVNRYDPVENLNGGAAYLKQLYDQFGNWTDALGAYNAGPTAYAAYKNGTGNLPAETQAYIPAVLAKAATFGYDPNAYTTPPPSSSNLTPLSSAAGAVASAAPSILSDPVGAFMNGLGTLQSWGHSAGMALGATDTSKTGLTAPMPGVSDTDPLTAVGNALASIDTLAGDIGQVFTQAWWEANLPYIVTVLAIGVLVLYGGAKVIKA